MPILFSMYHVVSNPMKYMMLGKNELLNMNFFGINLAVTPTWSYDKLFGANISNENLILLIVPVAAVITSYIATKYSMKQTSGNNADQMQSSMMSTMALISPIMTGIITFTVPAGLGLYWIISNAFQIFQQFLMNKFIIKKNSSLDSKWMKRISGILSSL
jgi:YidC/Oxa1 family membrane protein insertase